MKKWNVEQKYFGGKQCAAVLAAAVMLLAAGCGKEDEKVIEGSVQNIQSESSAPEEGSAQGGQVGGQNGTTSAEEVPKGYQFVAKGVTISINVDAAPLLEQLGEPVSYFEAPSCAFDGMDKTYTYNGFELKTYPDGKKDYVYAVIFKDDSIATPEGIAIGDSLEKLHQAYPEGGQEDSGMASFEKDGMVLQFFLENEEITAIQYMSLL